MTTATEITLIPSSDEAKKLADWLEVYAVGKRIEEAGVPMKQFDGVLRGTKASVIIRKMVRGYTKFLFPSADVTLSFGGPKWALTPEQSVYVKTYGLRNGVSSSELRKVIAVPEYAAAINGIHNVIRNTGEYVTFNSEGGNMSATVRMSIEQLDTRGDQSSRLTFVQSTITALESLRAALEAVMTTVPDWETAKEVSTRAERERERAELERRRVEGANAFDDLFGQVMTAAGVAGRLAATAARPAQTTAPTGPAQPRVTLEEALARVGVTADTLAEARRAPEVVEDPDEEDPDDDDEVGEEHGDETHAEHTAQADDFRQRQLNDILRGMGEL